jgi:RHH-type proline utilization regulon transcriptional repressor/proline dehydrogenase/delta 1-pyrroline-5-carboxylate dehydrogenase
MGRTIGEALSRAREEEDRGDRFSFDMLGEAARTADDAERYFQAYADAIGAIVDNATGADVIEKPGISVKLSALHPRYELAQRHRVRAELLPRLKQLAVLAADILRVVEKRLLMTLSRRSLDFAFQQV